MFSEVCFWLREQTAHTEEKHPGPQKSAAEQLWAPIVLPVGFASSGKIFEKKVCRLE
jgi:hypothetical protein